ncbi:MAG: hypothetical protein Q8K65_06570 [Alphaproteobacteria bacterium]|nr:hypothetical protein [Alphaproteobacteria bacterium]
MAEKLEIFLCAAHKNEFFLALPDVTAQHIECFGKEASGTDTNAKTTDPDV